MKKKSVPVGVKQSRTQLRIDRACVAFAHSAPLPIAQHAQPHRSDAWSRDPRSTTTRQSEIAVHRHPNRRRHCHPSQSQNQHLVQNEKGVQTSLALMDYDCWALKANYHPRKMNQLSRWQQMTTNAGWVAMPRPPSEQTEWRRVVVHSRFRQSQTARKVDVMTDARHRQLKLMLGMIQDCCSNDHAHCQCDEAWMLTTKRRRRMRRRVEEVRTMTACWPTDWRADCCGCFADCHFDDDSDCCPDAPSRCARDDDWQWSEA